MHDTGLRDDAWDKRNSALDLLLGMVETQILVRHSRPAMGVDIPVVIVAGFLGAGKTTLLRHLLTANHGQTIAAIVNDFAALNIDAALVANVSGDTVALENGCICCSLSGSVARTILAITERDMRPDAIIIEASGIADPANIAQVASALPDIRLSSIAVVVDATCPPATPEIEALQARQIAQADVILLNKTDLVPERQADAMENALRTRCAKATVLRTVRAAVPTAFLLDGVRAQQPEIGPESKDQPEFESAVLSLPMPIDRPALERCLLHLPTDIMRLKGFVAVSGGQHPACLVQAVGRRWSIEDYQGEALSHEIIAIGLKGKAIAALLASHLANFNIVAET